MVYIFEKEKLNQLVLDFYTSTGVAVTLYDSNMSMIVKSPIYTDFCACIRKKKACVSRCSQSDHIHMQKAKETKSTVYYTCHAGLTETITPIFYEDTLIAYLQTGQFRNPDRMCSQQTCLNTLNELYGIPLDKLTKLYNNTPVISKEKLQALQNIMNILIKNFWSNGLVYCNRSMLSIKIDQYITENLSQKIYIDTLCKKFHLSKNALYHLFKTEFNMTINELILHKRLNAAADMLITMPDLNITQIATQCGFTDYNYFIRIFKKTTGTTPLQYRKHMYLSPSPKIIE